MDLQNQSAFVYSYKSFPAKIPAVDFYYYITAASIISKLQAQGTEKIKYFLSVTGSGENNALLTTGYIFLLADYMTNFDKIVV